MQITASIVTYFNNKDVLFQAIKSFLNTSLNVKVFVVDNSNQGYIRELCHKFSTKQIEYVPTERNIGFGAGHNLILKDSEKLGKYHLVLNPDIRFENGTLESIYDFMELNMNVGNLMPKILYPDGSIQFLCKLLPSPIDWILRILIPIKSIKERINYRFEMRFTSYSELIDVPYLSGCFMFLRKEAIEKVGLFDEGIFMYGEDTDLNRRIGEFYRTVFFPGATVIHDFEKGSHKKLRLLIIHIFAAIYYFNKWGWFFDKNRNIINKNVLSRYSTKI